MPRVTKVAMGLWGLFLTACSYLPEAELVPGSGYEERAAYIKLPAAQASEEALIFYPGGLVDPHAYVPLLQRVAAAGVTVFILKVEANLAILATGKARKLAGDQAGYTAWYVGGHSLGGIAAQAAAQRAPDRFAGLILLGVYPAEGYALPDWDRNVLSLYAEYDQLSTVAEIEAKAAFLPPAFSLSALAQLDTLRAVAPLTLYHLIAGGNHAQFGSYGAQAGDGMAAISRDAQQAQTSAAIIRFIQWNEQQ